MKATVEKRIRRIRRHKRVRAKVRGTTQRPRLAVFRSNRYLWLQLIDDSGGRTLAAASEKELGKRKKGGRKASAEKIGELIAERAAEKNVALAVFDRASYGYHGLVRAVADGARKGGLKF